MNRNLRHRVPLLVAAALLLVIGVVWTVAAARAAQPLTLDEHVQVIASQLQCPICHGESVANSPSAVATEIRALIRKDLQDGMSDQQILNYFRDRYSDNILEVPPVQGFNALMWLGPLLVFLAAIATAIWALRRLRTTRETEPQPTIATTSARVDSEASDPLRDLLRRELASEEGFADAIDARKVGR